MNDIEFLDEVIGAADAIRVCTELMTLPPDWHQRLNELFREFNFAERPPVRVSVTWLGFVCIKLRAHIIQHTINRLTS